MNVEQVEGLVNLLEEYQLEDFGSYAPEDNLKGVTLTWFQCFLIEHAIISQGTLGSLGTGLGKTLTSIGYIVELNKRIGNGMKHFFLCLPESVDQVTEDFKKYSDLRVISTTGERASIEGVIWSSIDFYDVYVVSYEALYNIDFINWIVTYRDFLLSCTLDEAHVISQESQIHFICKLLANKFSYRLMLTATPLTVSPTQPLVLLNMLDESSVSNINKILEPHCIRDKVTFKVIKYSGLEDLSSMMYPRYVSWTRKELGLSGTYKVKLLCVDATDTQRNADKVSGYKILKGDPESEQTRVAVNAVKELVSEGKKGIVYAFHRSVCGMLEKVLSDAGVRVRVANGTNSKHERQEIKRQFIDGDIDVLVTNITESLNLSCDFIVAHENTNKFIQLLGRAERGLIGRDLDVLYVLTKDTVEIEQFIENVYLRCEYLESMLGKDADVIKDVMQRLNRC